MKTTQSLAEQAAAVAKVFKDRTERLTRISDAARQLAMEFQRMANEDLGLQGTGLRFRSVGSRSEESPCRRVAVCLGHLREAIHSGEYLPPGGSWAKSALVVFEADWNDDCTKAWLVHDGTALNNTEAMGIVLDLMAAWVKGK